jgi:hypothetical protein
MFPTPSDEAEAPAPDGASIWPAIAAALFAWAMAFARALIGRARHESLDIDVVLSVGAMLLIPSIVLLFWLSARRASRRARVAARSERPKLSLAWSAPPTLAAPPRALRRVAR